MLMPPRQPSPNRRSTLRRARSTPLHRLGALIIAVGVCGPVFWTAIALRDGVGPVIGWLGPFGVLIVSGASLAFIIVGAAIHGRAAAILSHRLAAAQGRLCPRCHYELDGLVLAGICPECGDPYTPESLAGAWRRRTGNRSLR